MALAVPLLCASMMAQATHFRYGSLTYQTTGGNGNRDVQFKISLGFREAFYGTLTIGQPVLVGSLDFGDGNFEDINLIVTSKSGDYFYGDYTSTTHTYATAGTYTANYTGGNRISTLVNNADASWYVSTPVVAGNANDSPVSSLQPIINLPAGQAAPSYFVPGADPNNNTLTFTAATAADLGGIGFVNAPGLVVNPTTGQVTFPTVGKNTGDLYNAVVKISDGSTSIIVDHIIQLVTQVSAPPVFVYPPTPTNGFVYTVNAGQLVSFTVRASDPDAGDVVTLSAVGLPAGSTFAPTPGNPAQGVFSFTPTAANSGSNVVNFAAQDNAGNQVTTSVTIQVNTCNPNANTPIAGTDNFTAGCGPLTVTAAQLLANDTSPNGTPLAIGSVGGGGNGTVVDNGNGTYTFTPFPGYTGPAVFTYLLQSAGPIFPSPATGHYYQLVSAPGICWDAAKTAAAAMTYSGMQGYLATLNTPADVNAVKGRSTAELWFGAADDVTEGTWMWKTGPELGQTFYTGGATVPGQYSNWSPGEPNDYKNVWRPIGEDYAHIYGGSGLWNDLDLCGTGGNPGGYIVEFGGLEQCLPILYATGRVNINVTNAPGTSALTANPNTFSTVAGTPVTVTAAQLLANDTDTQGRALAVSSVSGGVGGTVVDNGNNTYTFTPNIGYTGPATFTYLLQLAGPVFPSSVTGHYYEFVPTANLTWTQARAAAAARTYNGLQGYLATITSATETNLLKGRNPDNIWFGAADDVTEGTWMWKTGPEAGQTFYVGNGTTGGATVAGQYSNWSPGEPNDFKNQFRPLGEDYAHMYGNSGLWNDLSDNAGGSATAGYFAEYGGLEACTPVLYSTGTVTVNVTVSRGTASGTAKGGQAVLEAAPNPSNGQFSVRVVAAVEGPTQLDLFDLKGRRISALFNETLKAGEERQVPVNVSEAASGLYMVRLQSGQQVQYVRVAIQK